MKYFFAFLASVGLIVLVLILVIRGFSSGSSQQASTPLVNYASSNDVAQMTVDGPIVSNQTHQAYRVIVGSNEVFIETLQGYQYSVIATKTYQNNQTSFANFLRALDLAGFTKGDKNASDEANDDRGECAVGDRYVFELINNNNSPIESYWATSCGHQGTFKGDPAAVEQLFNRQIPSADFSELTQQLLL
jgi:hypothetical protein